MWKTKVVSVFLLNTILLHVKVKAEEITLLDTRKATSDLGWSHSPTTPLGWTEMTDTDENDVDLRTFQICSVTAPNQSNWLRTPYLTVGNAKRLYVEIRFTLKSCEDMPDTIRGKKVVTCKETFNLHYLESDEQNDDLADSMNEQTYKKLDTIAADEKFDEPNDQVSNTEIKEIAPVSSKGIYVAIQDIGACMAILHVKVYYKSCKKTLNSMAWFPTTDTGPRLSSLVKVAGKCINNAEISDKGAPRSHCNGEGEWQVSTGGCWCKAGYETHGNTKTTRCVACPVGFYKADAGNDACKVCPSNSFTMNAAQTSCKCRNGFYRGLNDRLDSSCTKPPSKPTMLQSIVNKTEVSLSWKEPEDTGGRDDVTYSVQCEKCTGNTCRRCEGVSVLPRSARLTGTDVTIRGLSAHTNYNFRVYAVNGVTNMTYQTLSFASISVRTNRKAPSITSPITVTHTTESEASLEWEQPESPMPVIDYQLRITCYQTKPGITNFTVTNKTQIRLENLSPATQYRVQVRARSKAGYGLYSRQSVFVTKEALVNPKSDPFVGKPANPTTTEPSLSTPVDVNEPFTPDSSHLIIVIAIVGFLLLVTIFILFIICRRKRKFEKKVHKDPEKYPGYINSSVDLLSSKTYVDPSTYEDPYTALAEFARELDSTLITIDQVIGRGEFGEVCKGLLAPVNREVAIKSLKVGYSNQEKDDFLSEASIMGQFDHPNVIRLEGVVTRSRPFMILTEFMERGSLDSFLQGNKASLTGANLTQMLFDVASGMKYLADKGYVHRDLAARNILVNSDLTCKVSDFGLSRVLKTAEEDVAVYTTRGGLIPIRWTAPEAITQRTFTTASDVWSYGILMWEVLSYGDRPYWEMTNQDVIHLVDSGYRLPPPCYVPRVLHSLTLECCNIDRLQRPTFSQLVNLLNQFLVQPALLDDTLNHRTPREQEECIPDVLDLTSLGQWLESIQLLHYKSLMLRQGCVTAEQIIRLCASELERMGITDPNHVNTILCEADVLRQKIEEVNHLGISV